MSAYVPAFDYMSTRYALQANTLHVNRGQWVTQGQGKGRLVALAGKLQVLWRMRKESFRSYVLRFKVAVARLTRVRRPKPAFTQLVFDFDAGSFIPADKEFYPGGSRKCWGCSNAEFSLDAVKWSCISSTCSVQS